LDDKMLMKELNKILTLEHGHLGMYEKYMDYSDKEIRRTFRRFMEVEIEHIEKLKTVIRNLGDKPSLIIEGGDIIGRLFNITINVADERGMLKAYSFIEQKAHAGYTDFVSKLENDSEKRNQFIAEIAASNMLEAKLMQLWLDDKLKNMHVQA